MLPLNNQPLTNIEQNALRYIAGYICSKIQDHVIESSHPHRQALLLFISDTAGTDMDESETENWTNIMDRGGLYHVNDAVYQFFYQIESNLRQHLQVKAAISGQNVGFIAQQVCDCNDVLYHWHIITDDQGTNTIYVDELYITSS